MQNRIPSAQAGNTSSISLPRHPRPRLVTTLPVGSSSGIWPSQDWSQRTWLSLCTLSREKRACSPTRGMDSAPSLLAPRQHRRCHRLLVFLQFSPQCWARGAGVGRSRMSARVGGAEASQIGREGPLEPIWQTKIQTAREMLSADALSKRTPAVQEDTSSGGARGALHQHPWVQNPCRLLCIHSPMALTGYI